MDEIRPVDEKQSIREQGDKYSDEFNEAKDRFQEIVGSELERDNRAQANEDIRFTNEPGGMWDDYSDQNWKGRPKFEVNQIQPMINVVVGGQRESDFTSKVIPLGGGATKKMADILNGLVRSINTLSNFDDSKNNGFREACTCGFGGWQLSTQWNESDPWVQDIIAKPIRSAINSLYWDPGSTGELNEDANYVFVCEWITRKDFEKQWPDATPQNMEIDHDMTYSESWFQGDKVRIADYWRKVPCVKNIGFFQRQTQGEDGQPAIEQKTWDIDEKTEDILDEAAGEGWQLVKSRKMHSFKVEHFKMCGSQFLEGPNEWAGKYLPVIPCYGYQSWLDGARRYWGIPRFAKDPARIYNYAWSSTIHSIAKAPKDPYFISREMVKNPKDLKAFQNIAQNDDPFLIITPDQKMPGGPIRTGAPQFPQAMAGVLAEATQNMQRVTGKFASSQGDNPLDQSGRAVIALQKQGDLGTYALVDNLAKSIRRHTEILIDLIPRIYDTERQIRITEADGSTKLVQTLVDGSEYTINDEFKDEATGETVLVIDLNQGRYDVSESIGASYSSKRQESLEALRGVAQASPQAGMLILDKLVELMDFAGTEDAVDRIKDFMVKQGLREPTEEEIVEAQKKKEKLAQVMPPQQPSPQEQIALQTAQLQLEALALENDSKELGNKKTEQEMMLKQQDALKKSADTEKALAETVKVEAQTDQIVKETNSFEQAEASGEAVQRKRYT